MTVALLLEASKLDRELSATADYLERISTEPGDGAGVRPGPSFAHHAADEWDQGQGLPSMEEVAAKVLPKHRSAQFNARRYCCNRPGANQPRPC
jgi:hypothetical protein